VGVGTLRTGVICEAAHGTKGQRRALLPASRDLVSELDELHDLRRPSGDVAVATSLAANVVHQHQLRPTLCRPEDRLVWLTAVRPLEWLRDDPGGCHVSGDPEILV